MIILRFVLSQTQSFDDQWQEKGGFSEGQSIHQDIGSQSE